MYNILLCLTIKIKKNCRSFWRQHIWGLLWSMHLVVSFSIEFALRVDLVKMRSVDPKIINFLSKIWSFSVKNYILISLHFHSFFQARYFFQQLISGVSYCHSMVCHFSFPITRFELLDRMNEHSYCLKWQQICHRDLKLENTLLDGSPAPRLKICDFGYSKVTKSILPMNYIHNISWLMNYK